MHKGYKCLHIPMNRVYISCDVVFDEHLFLYAAANSPEASPIPKYTLLPTLHPILSVDQRDEQASLPIMHDDSNLGSTSLHDTVFKAQDTTASPAPPALHSDPSSSTCEPAPVPDQHQDVVPKALQGTPAPSPTIAPSPSQLPDVSGVPDLLQLHVIRTTLPRSKTSSQTSFNMQA
jgi:hypothetical protein